MCGCFVWNSSKDLRLRRISRARLGIRVFNCACCEHLSAVTSTGVCRNQGGHIGSLLLVFAFVEIIAAEFGQNSKIGASMMKQMFALLFSVLFVVSVGLEQYVAFDAASASSTYSAGSLAGAPAFPAQQALSSGSGYWCGFCSAHFNL